MKKSGTVLFLLLAVCGLRMAAQEAATDITFHVPFYTPDAMSFFLSEYQNALANQKLVGFYLTVAANSYKVQNNRRQFYPKEYEKAEMFRLAESLGALLPLWPYHLSFILHGTYNNESRGIANNEGKDFSSFFYGGGLKADFGSFSIGFIGGAYGGGVIDNEYVQGVSANDPTVFRWTVPISLGLSEQIFFIDRLFGNFGFDEHFAIDKLFTELAFIPFRIMAAKVGVKLYYKDEGYSVFARQKLVGASLTTKYLQFDGGYRFFNNDTSELTYDDGPYGRLILKIPFGKKVALAFSAAYTGIDKKADSKMSYGIGISLFGNIWQTFVELGAELTVIEHLNYASLGE
ncbi:hypothetical protein FACS189485_03840 [Spirochaetia bacterium]|nr:hypothetical protein FACS189485_03840 [Spirochaetia bacterium]